MIPTNKFIDELKKNDLKFFSGVPDSVLKEFCFLVDKKIGSKHYVAANEGSAISLGIGYHLKTKKIPIKYSDIPKMYTTADGRRELAIYCVKDAWLSYKLMKKLSKIEQYIQLASVTGIGLKNVLERGQGLRSIGLILRKCKKLGYYIRRCRKLTSKLP